MDNASMGVAQKDVAIDAAIRRQRSYGEDQITFLTMLVTANGFALASSSTGLALGRLAVERSFGLKEILLGCNGSCAEEHSRAG